MLKLLLQEGWRQQAEIVHWLDYECRVCVSQLTMLYILKSKGWTKKKLYCLSFMCNESLYKDWQQNMSQFTVDDLIFLNESIFNKKTG